MSRRDPLPAAPGSALVSWAPAGRIVRAGSWEQQALPTPDLIEAAIADDRRDEASKLIRHLVREAEEIHELYTEWAVAIPRLLVEKGVAPETVRRAAASAIEASGAIDTDGEWAAFIAAIEGLANDATAGSATTKALEQVLETWRAAHDRHRDLVAAWVDSSVLALGEGALGDLWRELQSDGIESYGRYALSKTPWEESFVFATQTAIEGMHGHLGGPRRKGEVDVLERSDRVTLRFAPCGSGGRIRAEERFGTTTDRHDWAWNETGVCNYCVHCCVLMQLEPIDRLGFPVRVIDPPLAPGQDCTWTVYRDPAAVPAEAYHRVGREKPGASR